jgi:hypothetical protein
MTVDAMTEATEQTTAPAPEQAAAAAKPVAEPKPIDPKVISGKDIAAVVREKSIRKFEV